MYTNSMETTDCNDARRVLTGTGGSHPAQTLRNLIDAGHYELAAYRIVCGVLVEAWKSDGLEPSKLGSKNTAQSERGPSR
ncbi:MAG: hypothetical protein ACOC9B_06450 [Chloroflexota bacterium]